MILLSRTGQLLIPSRISSRLFAMVFLYLEDSVFLGQKRQLRKDMILKLTIENCLFLSISSPSILGVSF